MKRVIAGVLGTVIASFGLSAAAADHTLEFYFTNNLPNGVAMGALIRNQGRFQEVANGSSEYIHSPFSTDGSASTGSYDVVIHAKGDLSKQYCYFHVSANYLTSGRWDCPINTTHMTWPYECKATRPQFWNGLLPCTFDFTVK